MQKNPTINLEELVRTMNIATTMNECLWIGDKKHKTLYVNPVFEKLSGYTLQECIGQDCVFFFDEEGKKAIEEHHRLRKSGKSSQYEANMVTKTGEKIPLLISGSPTKIGGTIGIFTNLTMIKQLEKQERVARQIIKHSSEAIVILDQNRKIQLWNSGAEKIFGYKEKEVLDKKINIIIPREEEATNEDLLKEVEEKGFLKNFETHRLAKNNERIDVSLSVTKVLDDDNTFMGYLILYRDITQQKKVNNELQKRFEAIQDAYKELGFQKRQADYFFEIVESTVNKSSLDHLGKLIISAACMLTKCDGVVLRLRDKDSLKLLASIGVNNQWQSKNKIQFKNSFAEEAFKNKRPIIIHDIDSSEKHRGRKLLRQHGFKTLIVLPLFINDDCIGSLSLYATDPGKFRLIETDFLEKFAKQCALSIFVKIHTNL